MSPRVRLFVLAGGIATLFAVVTLGGDLSAERVRDALDGYGAAGPIVFICVSALLTVCLFPGPLLAGAAGLLFGTALGTPVAIVAATAGAALAFSNSRRAGAPAVEQLLHPSSRVGGIKAAVERRGFLAVLYARIAPGVPYSLVNYAAGLTRIALGTFALATAIGAAPRAFAYAALGGTFGNWDQPETLVAIGVLVGMAAAGLLLARREIRSA